jgi:hypothetical protein
MGNLLRTCVVSTALSVLSLIFLSNNALALTTRGYCVVLFSVPFTDETFEFPNWMWGPIPMAVCGLSTLLSLILWTVVLVRRIRAGSTSVSKPWLA